MKFEGTVKSSELPDIFQLLSSSGRQGALVVTRGALEQRVYFSPAGVTLPFETDRANRLLGRILLARGVINEQQLQSAIERQHASKLHIGEILCNAGAAAPQDVTDALNYQLREELFDLLTWENATFQFIENEAPPPEGRTYQRSVSFNTDAIIMEAARRADEWKRIRQTLPDSRVVLLRVAETAAAPSGENAEVASRLMELADGTRSMEEIVSALGRSQFDAYEAACELLKAGVLRPASPRELADLAAEALKSSQVDSARILLSHASALAGEDIAVRYDLGTLYLWADLEGEAAGHLDFVLGRLVEERLSEKIEQMLDQVRDQFPDAPYSYERRLKLLDRKKDIQKALPLAERLLELYKLRNDPKTCRRMLRHLAQFTIAESGDLARFGEFLEVSGQPGAAAHQYLLAARRLYCAGEEREAIELAQKAINVNPRNSETKKEVEEILAAPKRRLFRTALIGVLATVALAALVVLGIQLNRERVTGQALDRADATARDLLSHRQFDNAVLLYSSLLELPRTALTPLVRERIEDIRSRQAAWIAGRRFTTDKLKAQAESAAGGGDFDRASAAYRKLAELATAKESADEALAAEELLRRERSAYESRLSEARAHEAAARYSEAVAGYLDASRTSERLFRHDHVTLPLLVESVPSGADVLVDGKVVGKTPMVVRRALGEAAGVRLHLDGFDDETLNVSAGSRDASVRATLTPARTALWTFRDDASAAPAYRGDADAVACFVGRDGTLYAADVRTGAKIWERKPEGAGDAPVDATLVAGDRLIAAGIDGSLRAFDRRTGRELWRKPSSARLIGCPMETDGGERLLVVSAGGSLAWIDPADGRTTRTGKLPHAPAGHPSLAGDTLFYGTDDGSLQAFDLKAGKPLWKLATGREMSQAFSLAPGTLLVPLEEKEIVAVSTDAGKPLWRFDAGTEHLTAPATDGKIVFVASREGRLTALDAGKGRVIWRVSLDGDVNVAAVTDGATVFMSTTEGRLTALRNSDGTVLWKAVLPGPLKSPPMIVRNRLVVTTETGVVQAFE